MKLLICEQTIFFIRSVRFWNEIQCWNIWKSPSCTPSYTTKLLIGSWENTKEAKHYHQCSHLLGRNYFHHWLSWLTVQVVPQLIAATNWLAMKVEAINQWRSQSLVSQLTVGCKKKTGLECERSCSIEFILGTFGLSYGLSFPMTLWECLYN